MLQTTLAILITLAGPALGQSIAVDSATPVTSPGTVTTAATARDRLPNTVADVTFGIAARGGIVAEVQSALSTRSAQLSAYLKTTGAEQIRTQAVQIQPELDPKPAAGQPPKVVGYSGHIAVTLRTEATKLGDVLGGALQHGANEIEQTDLHPRTVEIDARHASLAAEATRIAIEEVRAVAQAAGRRVGAVRSLIVGTPQAIGPRPLMRAMATSNVAAPMTIDAGDTEVSATVTVTMALIEP